MSDSARAGDHRTIAVTIALVLLALSGCEKRPSGSIQSLFSVGGSITGLTGSGLVLQNEGGDDLAVPSGSTTFTFGTECSSGTGYDVTVKATPTGLACSVSGGRGTVGSADVTSVAIVCSAATHTVGGTVAGLTAGGLVLQNNGGDDLAVPSGATSFTFATRVAYGAGYSVSVKSTPPGLTCSVSNAAGTVTGADVASVAVTCSTLTYAIGGTVAGLTASGLVLQNNGGDDLAVPSGATSFTFATRVAYGAGYSVAVKSSPPGLTCSVSNAAGTVSGADVASVAVNCSTLTYAIGGTVTGLTASGLVLQNNGADDLAVPSGATSFTFANKLASGATYHITVKSSPSGLTCGVSADSGSVTGADVASVRVSCSTTTYSVGGSVTGLTASGLVLQNNGGDDCAVPSGATSFTFATGLPSGAGYSVTVRTSPAGLTCLPSGGSGVVGAASVTSIAIVCHARIFVTTAPMRTARQDHTATLLPSGRVLVAGGVDASGAYLSSAEEFDPTTGTFAAVQSMGTARSSHTATSLPNGTVLIAGGLGSAGYVGTAEVYDPSSGRFTATGTPDGVLQDSFAVRLRDGRVLVAGSSIGAAWLYDTSTGNFTSTGGMPSRRFGAQAVLASDGTVLVVGGWVTAMSAAIGDLLYSPSAGTFSTITSPSVIRRDGHTVTALLDGTVLVAGGAGSGLVSQANADVFTPSSRQYAASGSMSTSRKGHSATLLASGLVLVTGGTTSSTQLSLASSELYDPATKAFSPSGMMSVARTGHTATRLNNGLVLVAGGRDTTPTAVASAELYWP